MNKIRQNLWYLGVLAALCLFGLKPLFVVGHSWNGHDLLFGLQRIAAAERAFQDGQWFMRWSGELYGGYGYPLLLFYPPLFTILAVYLKTMLGCSVLTIAKLLIGLSYVGSGVFTYLFLRDLWSGPQALAGALIYLYFPYHTALIYMRGAMAEFLAVALMPALLWALQRLLAGGGLKSFLAVSLAYGLLMLAHNAVWLMLSPFIAGYILINWRRGWRRLAFSASALAAGLGWTAFYWLPAFIEKQYIDIENLITADTVDYTTRFVPLEQFLIYDDPFFGISALLLAIFMLSWLWSKPWDRDQRLQVWFLRVAALGSIFMATNLSRFLWDNLTILQFIGYPWRFMSLAGLFAACLAATVFENASNTSEHSLIAPVVAVLFFLPLGMKYANPKFSWFDEEAKIGFVASRDGCSSTVVADEYRPRWVKSVPCTALGIAREPYQRPKEDPYIVIAESRSNRCSLAVSALEPFELTLNMIYFPGWSAKLDDGTTVPISYDNDYGLMELNLPAGQYETLISWNATAIRKLGAGVSLATICFLILLWGRSFRRRGKAPIRG